MRPARNKCDLVPFSINSAVEMPTGRVVFSEHQPSLGRVANKTSTQILTVFNDGQILNFSDKELADEQDIQSVREMFRQMHLWALFGEGYTNLVDYTERDIIQELREENSKS